VVDGGFESDSYPGTPATPWNAASYDTTCSYKDINPGFNGSTRAVELSCTNTANSDAIISQDLTTCSGVRYNLSFYYRIVYGQAYGSYVQINVTDTATQTTLCSENLENYCPPSTTGTTPTPLVDGYGNPEGDWYQANSTVAKGFGQITAMGSTTTVQILLRSGNPAYASQTLIIDFDNIAFQAIVPAGATVVGH